MKAIYKELLDNSISGALSAIEIYNKPDFKYRNEVFSILIINAWELLFKAKIIKDNKNKINSIYVYRDGKIKKNRNNAPMTIEIRSAMDKLCLDEVIKDNLNSLIEIRDSAIHFYNKDSLPYLVYTLSVACLKNYQKLIKIWFDKDLLEYNFYILPLGFAYNFKTYTQIDLKKESKIIKEIIETISNKQKEVNIGEEEFYFTCEIEINLKSAKKVYESTDFSVTVDNKADNVPVIVKNQNLTDRYPLSYTKLIEKLKENVPTIKHKDITNFFRNNDIKSNSRYSAYNYRTKEHEETCKKETTVKGVTSIYNEDCLRFLIQELSKVG